MRATISPLVSWKGMKLDMSPFEMVEWGPESPEKRIFKAVPIPVNCNNNNNNNNQSIYIGPWTSMALRPFIVIVGNKTIKITRLPRVRVSMFVTLQCFATNANVSRTKRVRQVAGSDEISVTWISSSLSFQHCPITSPTNGKSSSSMLRSSLTWTFPHSLHLSQPTQSKMPEMFLKWTLKSSWSPG